MEDRKNSGTGKLAAAFILLLAGLYVQVPAITILSQSGLTADEKFDKYLGIYPEFLRNNLMLPAIAFFACLAAFILAAVSLDRVHSRLRWLAFACIALSFLTGLLSLFQMM